MAKQSELARVLAHIDSEIEQLQLAKDHILQVQAKSQARERGRSSKRKRTPKAEQAETEA